MDTSAQSLALGHDAVTYDKLVLATGAGPRILDAFHGADYPVAYLRNYRDAEHLRSDLAQLEPGSSVAVVGGGILGVEVASAAVDVSDAQVHFFEVVPQLCQRVLPSAASEWLEARARAQGVEVTCNVAPQDLPTLVEGVAPSMVIVCVGLVRDTMLAEDAGIAVGDGAAVGIVVDDFCVTSAPGVYAIGDYAEVHVDGVLATRPESEFHAKRMAEVAARHLLDSVGYAVQPLQTVSSQAFRGWTKAFGTRMKMFGDTSRAGTAGEAGGREVVLANEPGELAVLSVRMVADPAGSDTLVPLVVGVTVGGSGQQAQAAEGYLGQVYRPAV